MQGTKYKQRNDVYDVIDKIDSVQAGFISHLHSQRKMQSQWVPTSERECSDELTETTLIVNFTELALYNTKEKDTAAIKQN